MSDEPGININTPPTSAVRFNFPTPTIRAARTTGNPPAAENTGTAPVSSSDQDDEDDEDSEEDEDEARPLMTSAQVAEALGVDTDEVDELLDNGGMDGQGIADGRLIRRASLLKLALIFEKAGTPVDASADEIELAMQAGQPLTAAAVSAIKAKIVNDTIREIRAAAIKAHQGIF